MISIDGNELPVKKIRNINSNEKVIIAAQPVREKVATELKNKGMIEWEDYIIIA
ncbi:hypothetical protein [Marinospirillum insulare]|uniref:Uncharacterized protein n=1 Tax=Marinospirillum insulare TaxID=217169 RepID=A0ABQ6A4K2_9GAMM|nr:hypothetical protein [Marinospirillum insulare]GLR65015.1 hypothetical protein GCM10007878_24540 [Marinospirillum insulare]